MVICSNKLDTVQLLENVEHICNKLFKPFSNHITGSTNGLIDWNNIRHLIWPQYYETRNQLQEKNCKNTNKWRLENMLLSNQWITEEIKKKYGDKWKQEHSDPKSMGCSNSSCKREVYSDKGLPQETRKISNKQLNLTRKDEKNKNKTQS